MPIKIPARSAFQPDWFLPEWMATLGLRQADIIKKTDWSRGTVSNIYNGKTDYYRAIVNDLARALNIEPYELLMHPDEAMAIRRMRQSALQIAAEPAQNYRQRAEKWVDADFDKTG